MLTQTVTITQNSNPNIIIGRRSTYETQQVIFDVSWLVQTYGEGTAELLIKRPKDASAYPVVATLDGNTLTWTVSETDTQDKGHGECEIYWYVNGGLAKSCICGITILRDIGDTTETAPDPYETWVETLSRLGAETLTNAQAAQQSANDAAQSASEADNSAAAALESEENALNSENAAKASEQAAAASKQGAEQSATEAAQSANAAESSAANARESADNSSASADRAEQAAASIEGDTERAEAAAQTAQGAASDASRFAGTASTKATEAAGSAATAEQAANTATQKASDASASATAAAGSASSASASATAAGNAQSAAETAQGKAEDAQEAAETAAQSIEDSAAQIDENTADIADLKSAFEAHEQYAEETYAKQDGTYEDLTAGNAYELLSDRGDTNQQPYLFRQTGGDSSAYNREQLKKIVGGTVAWNQHVSNGNFENGSTGWRPYNADNVSISAENGVLTANFINDFTSGSSAYLFGFYTTLRSKNGSSYNHIEGHKCLITAQINVTKAGIYAFDCNGTSSGKSVEISTANAWNSMNVIFNANANNSNSLIIEPYVKVSTSDTIKAKNIQHFDLTQMFGATVADYIYSLEQATAGAGVAFFRSLFPADYYDYNPGELMSVEGVSAHETVGFNQWDEEWEPGNILDDTGRNANDGSTEYWRSKNYIRVVGGVRYHQYTDGYNGRFRHFFYDANYNYLGYTAPTATNSTFTFIVPAGAAYMRFRYYTASTNYKNCINLSDPKRNGTYEPYKKRTYPLDSSLTLRGIPKLDSNNRLYYDGDTYEPDGTVTRRFKEIVLDGVNERFTSAWGSVTNGYAVYKKIDDIAEYGRPLILADKFINFEGGYNYMPVWSVGGNNGAFTTVTFLFPSTIASTADANNWLKTNNVRMIYPVATPTTETAEPYRELEICDRDGTEEFVSTSIVPVGHETFYPVNVFDYIDRLTEPDADMIADSAIAANKYFSVGNRLFLSTASIAAGAMIIPGTNCTETSLAAALNALNA